MGAWNGGKIISLTISSAADAPVVEGAEQIVIEAPKALEGDYLHIFESAGEFTIYPDLYLPGWVPGQTIYMTIELEGNGAFGGGIGTCVNKWAWEQHEFSSNADNTCTVELFITPLMNNFYFGMWWVGGTQVGIKSITVEKAIDYRDPNAVVEEEEDTRAPYEGNANASFSGYADIADSSWWTEKVLSKEELIGDVDPATITSIVLNGEAAFKFGYNSTTAGAYTGLEGILTGTVTDVNFNDFFAHIGLSKGDGEPYRFTWDVYTNGATPAVDPGAVVEDPNVKTLNYVIPGDGTELLEDIDLNAIFPDLAVGQQVKFTIETIGDKGSAGWYGYSFGVGINSDTGWTQENIETWGSEDLTRTMTITVPYGSGNVGKIESWAAGGGDTAVKITLERTP